jgi:fucose 4-O-acetylase-like acetyltransferase
MNQNAIKGLLIILVMFDHNEYAHQLFPVALQGFAFHVLGFLALPFLRPPEAASQAYFQKILFRYYYPFFLITCAMSILTMVITGNVSLSGFENLLLALYSGNNDILKSVTQMALLWFLPSFLSVLLIRKFLGNHSYFLQRLTLVLFIAAHFFIADVAIQIRNYLPLGLLPAIYAIPLCYIAVFFNKTICRLLAPIPAVIISVCFFLVVKYFQMRLGLSQELGFAEVSDFSDPLGLLINDLEAVSGVLMLFQIARLKLPSFLEKCGDNSLQVYLIHPFIALFVFKALEKLAPQANPTILLFISILPTIWLSVTSAKIVMGNKLLRQFLFPKDYDAFTQKRDDDDDDAAVRSKP